MTETKKPAVIAYDRDIPEIEDHDAWRRPDRYLQKNTETDEIEIVDGRRPSQMLLVNKLRDAVDAWRDQGYPGASATTTELFGYWFSGGTPGPASSFTPYWGQREAVETLAYLLEVEQIRDVQPLIAKYATASTATLLNQVTFEQIANDPQRYVKIPTEDGATRLPIPPMGLPRFACKMATGSGKTFVMAMVIVWAYFHARREQGSPMSTNFLVLAPNVIVFERLRADFENGQVFRDNGLIPPGWSLNLRVILRGEATEPASSGNLIVTNIQQLQDNTPQASAAENAIQRLLGLKPTGNAATKGRSMLERVRGLDSLMVLNDEAHHVHDDDLVWSQTLLDLHAGLAHGLAAWLDFSATPRNSNGVDFPWIVCDYPLAQAVEDQIVKAPMILHVVDKPDPTHVTSTNVIDKYGDWLVAGVNRLREHEKAFKILPGTKPVLFIMCETTQHADRIGEWLCDPHSGFKFKANEVLVIHTKGNGEIREKDLEKLRKDARDIDSATNPIKVVVSVLVLREGWDVRNVTLVMGLRPGTAAANILPEQAVGRGLRLMPAARDNRQVLEVLGTPAFENFVRQLEAEGVYIKQVSKAPAPPVKVYPIDDRKQYDIEIPRTTELIHRTYSRLSGFDPALADALFELDATTGSFALRVKVEDATYNVDLAEFSIDRPGGPLTNEIVANIVNMTAATAQFTNKFAELYPLIETYLRSRCFGTSVDLEDRSIRGFLSDPTHREQIARYLGNALGHLTAVPQDVSLQQTPLRLSDTEPFTWRRKHIELGKTIFNVVATFNDYESDFGTFLDDCEDIDRFAALAETFTRFAVEYLKPSGALGHYYPDWVAIQATDGGDVSWIIETKGRVWDGTAQKDAAIGYWCNQVTKLKGQRWGYMRVDQAIFKPESLPNFAALVDLIRARSEATNEMVFLLPD